MKKYKKWVILLAILLLPSSIYLGLTSGKHNFNTVSVVNSLSLKQPHTQLLKNKLHNHISIIHFYGNSNSQSDAVSFNLLKKIYERFHTYHDFKIISLITNSTDITKKLSSTSSYFSTKNWEFVQLSKHQIHKLYKKLDLNKNLNSNNASPFVFIIDKDINIRAGYSEKKPNEFLRYNGNDIGTLKEMIEDIKMLLAEYRMELKKNNKYKRK